MKTALQSLTLSLTLTLNQAKMGCLGAGSAHEALAWLRVAASQGLSAAETAACGSTLRGLGELLAASPLRGAMARGPRPSFSW